MATATPPPVEARQIFARGLRMRCPRCGEGPIFRRVLTYSELRDCPKCGLAYDPRGESLAFMWLSTAFITGLWFIVLILFPPRNLNVYRIALVCGALALYAVTMPLRKALAIALNYFNSR
jgi:uncharacterized protein (DUF983 family)